MLTIMYIISKLIRACQGLCIDDDCASAQTEAIWLISKVTINLATDAY